MIDAKDIIVDAEFESWLGRMEPHEYAALVANVTRDGFREKLVVWLNHSIIIDGHHRLRIWQEVFESDPDKAPEVIELPFKDRAAVLQWMFSNQDGRRNWTYARRVQLALHLKPALTAEAKARQSGGQGGVLLRPNSDEAKPMRVDERIAQVAGVGKDTVRKVEFVLASGDEAVKADMLADRISINAAHKMTVRPVAATDDTGNDSLEPVRPAFETSMAHQAFGLVLKIYAAADAKIQKGAFPDYPNGPWNNEPFHSWVETQCLKLVQRIREEEYLSEFHEKRIKDIAARQAGAE